VHDFLDQELLSRRQPEVHGQRHALVLEQQAAVLLLKAAQPAARLVERCLIDVRTQYRAGRQAHLETMFAGCRETKRGEQLVELLERPSTQQCERALLPREAELQRVAQRGGNAHAIGRRRDLEQRPVHVQEQGEVVAPNKRCPGRHAPTLPHSTRL
jgi:hypothetical protein